MFSSLRSYDRRWLRGDLIAGLTVWAVLVPESLAYASIAGVSPVVGLYAAPAALVLYAAFAYNFLGIPPEDRLSAAVPTDGRHIIGVEFTIERMGENRKGIGPTGSSSPEVRSSASCSTLPMTRTSTSRHTSPPRWHATDVWHAWPRPTPGPGGRRSQASRSLR